MPAFDENLINFPIINWFERCVRSIFRIAFYWRALTETHKKVVRFVFNRK